MSKQKDHVVDIMDKWYKAMEENKIAVQPKASTILGSILADYTISTEAVPRDIWREALSVKGGDFPSWYANLSDSEKKEYEEGRNNASAVHDPRNSKQLLKG